MTTIENSFRNMMIQLFLSLSDSAAAHTSGNHVEIPSRHFCYALRTFLLLFSPVFGSNDDTYLWRAKEVSKVAIIVAFPVAAYCNLSTPITYISASNEIHQTCVPRQDVNSIEKQTHGSTFASKTFCLIDKSRFPRNASRHVITGALLHSNELITHLLSKLEVHIY